MADNEYESLVREQLTQLGYNSEAIPDEVFTHPARLFLLPLRRRSRLLVHGHWR